MFQNYSQLGLFKMKTGKFNLHRGPLFGARLKLVDEIFIIIKHGATFLKSSLSNEVIYMSHIEMCSKYYEQNMFDITPIVSIFHSGSFDPNQKTHLQLALSVF